MSETVLNSRPKKERWPQTVRSGSVEVKIYRIHHPKTASGWIYSVSWYSSPGQRKQRQFTKPEKARTEARLMADRLAAGELEIAHLAQSDARELIIAQQIAGEYGIIPALEEWKKGRELCDGTIIPACQMWAERVNPSFQVVTLEEAAEKFLESKSRAGIQIKRGPAATLKWLLPELGKHTLTSIRVQDLERWLSKYENPVTRNTHRKRIVTLWRWARKNGFLPQDAQTEAERTERAHEEAPPTEVTTPDVFKKLLEHLRRNHPHYLPAAILAGFCGLRRIEVHRQSWDDIMLDRKLVRVTSAKRGTPARRLIPLCDSACEWLALASRDSGPINDSNTWEIDRIRKIGRTLELHLPPNCFRDSFISYRTALSGNVDRTAIEAGNSRRMIFRHYFEAVPKEVAKQWFAILPG